MLESHPLMAVLPASDLGRAKAFYRDVLGIKPIDESGDGTAWYEVGGMRFLVYESQFAGSNQATAALWIVDGIEGIVNTLKKRGVEFQEFEGPEGPMVNSIASTSDGAKLAWFLDSERNIINLAEIASD